MELTCRPQLITLALGPVLWVPIANRYGRRPIWLISVIGAGLFNMGCALSQSYGANMACRVVSVSRTVDTLQSPSDY
jgi:MFS family permease